MSSEIRSGNPKSSLLLVVPSLPFFIGGLPSDRPLHANIPHPRRPLCVFNQPIGF
uniref:Uncharacterized protein n=1 Tax=Utricularia reniformis TaxID=192314 RepID=A0A1Y0B0L7_9LAMI|nr:hypothetical protein AEK19_MT0667 [Utricularia reniformis]ART30918.1 hypothetical protein AEK19_MT0667 [Utricularia reniformis]